MNAAYLAIVVGLIMLTYGCITTQPPANGTSAPPIITNATPILNTTNSSNPPHINLTALTKESCEAARGHWNPCGSACRGEPPGTPCIQVCFAYCECGGIAGFGCPEGYQCRSYLPLDKNGNPVPDAMGVCMNPNNQPPKPCCGNGTNNTK